MAEHRRVAGPTVGVTAQARLCIVPFTGIDSTDPRKVIAS